VRRFAPRVGEHTADILAEAGYAAAEIDALAAARVVGLDPGPAA
jgi:crotonobetainyl-CoA:carnitine CoA-transferase CaiB-like acyl-CoA transferase